MSLKEKLQDLGWHISQEGIDTISENGQEEDINVLSKRALDHDLRDIGEAAFPEDFAKEPTNLEKPIIVQIQKIRNVSAPKANEDSTSAPRMLKLTLHDGNSTCTALEITPISSISINTPPGTKVLLKNEGLEACHGVLWLTPSVISVLGGNVSHMIEKWELNRSLAKHTRGGIGADGGPPPWIPFGQRLEALNVDKHFKSIQEANKQDNAEFEAQRKGAIAEAQRLSGVKKVFGGGSKLLDANVQKLIDAGFSEEQAENTLKYTKNNVDRALKILQKRDSSENRAKEKQKETEQPKRKGRNRDADDDVLPVKPTGKVSLFDFLEDKLPNVPEKDRNNRQNNMNTDERNEKYNNHNRDRNNGKNNSRSQNSRYDNGNRFKSDRDRAQHSNDNHHAHHREERKYQPPNEKPPRFQKKMEDRNKLQLQNYQHKQHQQPQHQQHQQYQQHQFTQQHQLQPFSQQQQFPHQQQQHQQQQQQQHQFSPQQQQQQLQYNNSNLNMHYNTNFPQGQTQYGERNIKPERNENKPYRNNIDSLVDATANMNLMAQRNEDMQRSYQEQYTQKQYNQYNQNQRQEMNEYRRGNDVKYQEGYRRGNGYMEGGYGGYGYRPEYGYRQEAGARAPFLPGSLLGFQNAAVNEQARAMLGIADLSWNIGDRCLALYWEDNNYYEAEVTGISANTVVVKFCAYGNHEEVLKSNCLPFPSQGESSSNSSYGRDSFGRQP